MKHSSLKKESALLLAIFGVGLSDCNDRIALSPIGVAALSRPNAFAIKFIVIRPVAG